MDIRPLLDLACLKVTFMINGRSEDEVSIPSARFHCNIISFSNTFLHSQIREILNLPAMTPEEETKAREQHPWIFENNNNN
jgi:hypothetical protein